MDVQAAAVVVVHDLENPLHTKDTSSSSRCQAILKHLNQLIIRVLQTLVLSSTRAVDLLGPCHSWIIGAGAGHVRAASSWHVLVGLWCLEVSSGGGLPLSLWLLAEWSGRVSAKQVPVVVSPVSFPRVHGRDLARAASKGHIRRRVARHVPHRRHYQLELRILLYHGRNVRVVVHEFFKRNLLRVGIEQIVVLLKSRLEV